MIILKSGVIELKIPEAFFGMTLNRYNTIKLVASYTGLDAILKNPDLLIRSIKLSNIPNEYYNNFIAFLRLGEVDDSNVPYITLYQYNAYWVGAIIGNITLTYDKKDSFSISFDFVGRMYNQ